MKRAFDIFFSIFGLLILAPFFLLIAILIKMESRGPVFFLHTRIGKDGKPFKMYKFRTMMDIPHDLGPSASPHHDPRVTDLGRFLRRFKINELPQLINVLRGEVSFVGPRPMPPDVVETYSPEQRKVLSVRPGIVGPAQILGRNEEDMYPIGVDPEKYFIEHILPEKLKIDLEYIRTRSFFNDLKYVFLGVMVTIFGFIRKQHILDHGTQILFFTADLFFSVVSYFLAYLLRFGGMIPGEYLMVFLQTFPFLIPIRIACFIYFGLYYTLARYVSITDLLNIIKAVTLGSGLIAISVLLFRLSAYPRSIFFIDGIMLIGLMAALRISIRLLRQRKGMTKDGEGRNVLIFGAGDAGELAERYLSNEPGINIMGFIDDDLRKLRKRIHGKKVLGSRYDLEILAKLYRIDEVFIAISNISAGELRSIASFCQKAHLRYRMFPTIKDTTSGALIPHAFRNLEISDLIEEKRPKVDIQAIKEKISGKRVMITGACGALASELCLQVAQFDPERIILLDECEGHLIKAYKDTMHYFPEERISPYLCRINPSERVKKILSKHRPHIIFHSFPRSHIPIWSISSIPSFSLFRHRSDRPNRPNDQIDQIIEDGEVVKENVLGSYELAKLADMFDVHTFTLISSHRAQRTEDLAGLTMKAAEICIQSLCQRGNIRYGVVRLGNLLEGKGGIVDDLKDQIERSRSVSIPHPGAMGCFISGKVAASLILNTLLMSENGGVYILDSGTPVRILDIAEEVIHMMGFRPYDDVKVKFREVQSPMSNVQSQAYEINSEFRNPNFEILSTSHDMIKRVNQTEKISLEETENFIGRVKELVEIDDSEGVIEELKRFV